VQELFRKQFPKEVLDPEAEAKAAMIEKLRE
jgi:hypothetical protein